MRRVIRHQGEGRIVDAQQLRGGIHHRARQEFHPQLVSQGIQSMQIPGIAQPPEIAALGDVVLDQLGLARQQIRSGAGDDQDIGIVRNEGRHGQVGHGQGDALALQFLGELLQIMVGLALRRTLAMALHKHNMAFLGRGQPLQSVGQAGFARFLNALAAALVVHDHFAVHLNTQLPHLFRLRIRIDEVQGQVLLGAAVAIDKISDRFADLLIFPRIRGDRHRILQQGEHFLARLGQGMTMARGPVKLGRILGAEPGQQTHGDQKQQAEQQVLQPDFEVRLAVDLHFCNRSLSRR